MYLYYLVINLPPERCSYNHWSETFVAILQISSSLHETTEWTFIFFISLKFLSFLWTFFLVSGNETLSFQPLVFRPTTSHPTRGPLGRWCPTKPQIWAFNASLAVIALPWNSSEWEHSHSWLLVRSQRLHFCLSDRGVILVRRLQARPVSRWEIWEFEFTFLD